MPATPRHGLDRARLRRALDVSALASQRAHRVALEAIIFWRTLSPDARYARGRDYHATLARSTACGSAEACAPNSRSRRLRLDRSRPGMEKSGPPGGPWLRGKRWLLHQAQLGSWVCSPHRSRCRGRCVRGRRRRSLRQSNLCINACPTRRSSKKKVIMLRARFIPDDSKTWRGARGAAHRIGVRCDICQEAAAHDAPVNCLERFRAAPRLRSCRPCSSRDDERRIREVGARHGAPRRATMSALRKKAALPLALRARRARVKSRKL